MGEFAKYKGHEIKIGTCQDMYYLRYNQRGSVIPLRGNINPTSARELAAIRFRFPFPEEDGIEPGCFEPFTKLDFHGAPCVVGNGIEHSRDCNEGEEFGIGRQTRRPQLIQNAVRSGKLVPIFQCSNCRNAIWRIEDEADLVPYFDALLREAENEPERAGYFREVVERMKIRAV